MIKQYFSFPKIVAFLFLSLLSFDAFSQDTTKVSWELSRNTGISYFTEGPIIGINQTVSNQYVIYDYGGKQLSQRAYSTGGNKGFWPKETSKNSNRFCEFKTYPRKGVDFRLTSISMQLGGSNSNKLMVSVFYSTNNFTTRTALIENKVLPLDDLKALPFDFNNEAIILKNQDTLAIRVYPWLYGGIDNDAFFTIRDVLITGISEGTVIPDLPKVETVEIDNISTHSVTFKGKAIDDGGVPFDSLGVVFDTSSDPTISNNVVLVDAQKGSFSIILDNLTKGTNYFAKAFAVNGAGVVYSDQIEFTTLNELSVPEVSTDKISHISHKGAVVYGTTNFDGGLEVTLTGFCYGKQSLPTINDLTIYEGKGLGKFSAYLNEVEDGQNYFVRAFAQNAEGIGYGNQIELKIPNSSPELLYTVDKNGNGDYTTVQEAFDAVPSNYFGTIKIYVKNGIYNEKVILQSGKNNVHLLGENRDSTIIVWDDYSGRNVDGVKIGTSTSYSVAINADDFIAQDITFQNTSQKAQAVAIRIKGDRLIFNHCNLLGFQDTYYTWGLGRIYHEDCYIEGTVDFIFGSSVAIFNDCLINSKRNSPITAASTEDGFQFGYVFTDCKLIADKDITKVTLGRPWRPFAQTVFLQTEMGSHIKPEGWSEWSGNNNHLTAFYAEYNCTGEGFNPETRFEWSHQLNDEEAVTYNTENIFSKQTASPAYAYNWMPDFIPIEKDPDMPSSINNNLLKDKKSFKIYPNPIKGNFNFEYELSKTSNVKISLIQTDGKIVKQQINNTQNAGKHSYSWNTCNLNLGIYIIKLETNSGNNSQLLMVQ